MQLRFLLHTNNNNTSFKMDVRLIALDSLLDGSLGSSFRMFAKT